jgi:hypothetical protein
MELANLIYYAVVILVFLVIIIAILTRLRLIVNNTFSTHKHPVIRHFTEARILEVTGDKTAALQEYYRCYVALKSLNYTYIFIPKGGKLTKTSVENKIKELGGIDLADLLKV